MMNLMIFVKELKMFWRKKVEVEKVIVPEPTVVVPVKNDEVEKLKKENEDLKNRNLANDIIISKLSEEYRISSISYLDDMKRLLLRLGGECYIDAVTNAAAQDPLLTIDVNYDKNGGVLYTLVKQRSEKVEE